MKRLGFFKTLLAVPVALLSITKSTKNDSKDFTESTFEQTCIDIAKLNEIKESIKPGELLIPGPNNYLTDPDVWFIRIKKDRIN